MSDLNIYKFICDENDIRLDTFLSDVYPHSSRTYIQKLIKDGYVTVNDIIINKPSYKTKEEDDITLSVPEPIPLEIMPENIPLDIIYEDDDLLIVNKPKGMVVHPANGHYEHTLVNALMYHCKDSLSGINGIMRPGIVHRIDMDTSGSLIICKNDYTHQNIAEQLKVHSIKRIYRGIVTGHLKDSEGTVDIYMQRDKKDRKRMAECNSLEGKRAITHYKVLESLNSHDYAEFELETGRTHQIRLSMKILNHPLLGDYVYGSENNKYNVKGQMLHAKTIGFVHPRTNEYVEFEAPLPDEFNEVLNKLK